MEHEKEEVIKRMSPDEKYAAIGHPGYEGMFIFAVRTTGIFCRPGCRAKRPKRENVAFFGTAQAALKEGFRPCKKCDPMLPEGTCPPLISELISTIDNDPFEKVGPEKLRSMGLGPDQVRRWFKKHHGMTFNAYQRLLRLNNAYQKLQEGETVATAAMESGYESMSGFGERFKEVFGASPTKTQGKTIIHIARIATLLGPIYACASEEGLCLLEFTERKMLETSFKHLCDRLNAVILPGSNRHTIAIEKEINAYLQGTLQQFSVPFQMLGTPFQVKVWQQLLAIPYGKTISYQQLATAIGDPSASRAVATANGKNILAILIPCHRVIGSDGNLTGYSGGLQRKKWLLTLEREKAMKDSGGIGRLF